MKLACAGLQIKGHANFILDIIIYYQEHFYDNLTI